MIGNVGQVVPDYRAMGWAFFDIKYYSHTFSIRSDSGAPMERGKQRFRYKDNYSHRSQGYGQDDYRNFSTTCREVIEKIPKLGTFSASQNFWPSWPEVQIHVTVLTF